MRAPKTALLPQYIYELGKGVRQLFMLTMTLREARAVCARLETLQIAFHAQPVGETKVNLFFGNVWFVAAARQIAGRPVNELSPEEDFILGTLLGYDREQQCRRFIDRHDRSAPACPTAAHATKLPTEPRLAVVPRLKAVASR